MTATRLRLLSVPLAVVGLLLALWAPIPAGAATPIGLGTAATFAVLAGTTATNTGPSTLHGDVGVSPGTALTGFGTATVTGTQHGADGVADRAQSDLTTAYTTAAGESPTATVSADLGGQTLAPGVYAGPTLGLTGTLTLDAADDPNAIFVFQAESTLTTASTSVVALVRGADPCNVFWQVGSSATLGTGSVLTGSVLALTSISATSGTRVAGRLLARNGAVTLDSVTVTVPMCRAATATATASPTPTATVGPTATATPGPGGPATPTPTPGTGTGGARASSSPAPSAGSNTGSASRSEVVTGRQVSAPPTELTRTGAPIQRLGGAGLLLLAGGLLLLLLPGRRRRT